MNHCLIVACGHNEAPLPAGSGNTAMAGKERTMYKTPYETLDKLVEKGRFWAICREFKYIKLEMHAKYLEDILRICIEEHDDEQIAQYFLWIMKALADNEFVPLLEQTKDMIFLPSTEEVYAAMVRARTARTAKAMELYPLLPEVKTEKVHQKYDDDPYTVGKPTLLETKKTILTEITRWWRETKDEEEADRLFDFLISVEGKMNKGILTREEDKKIIHEAIRAATDHGFSPNRLVRCFLKIVPPGTPEHKTHSREIARMLAVAWARNSELDRLSLHFCNTNPLCDCSPAAFNFIGSIASDVVALDRAARKLKLAIHPEGSYLREIPGDIDIGYPTISSLRLAITIKSDDCFEENTGHDYFLKAEKHVKQWKKDHSLISVHLSLKVNSKHDKKQLFSRERTI